MDSVKIVWEPDNMNCGFYYRTTKTIALKDQADYITLAHELTHAWRAAHGDSFGHEEYGIDVHGVYCALTSGDRVNYGREADMIAYLVDDMVHNNLTEQQRYYYKLYAKTFLELFND